eukprot:m.215936 g.215936  ORF g.215936 m.215936 type:complete len:681 (+) comp44039_c0_seq1:53-2095(+)
MAKSIFINHVDSYVGRALGKIFSTTNLKRSDADGETPEDARPTHTNSFVIRGTVRDAATFVQPPWLSEVVTYKAKEDLQSTLMASDIVIYDIFSREDQIDEATWAVSMMQAECQGLQTKKVFICLSSLLTWGRTPPTDPEDPDIPLTEDEYRRRRPHATYKNHINVEKVVVKCGKDAGMFKTFVIASGLQYGMGENGLHSLFKMAWHLKPAELPLFGNGENIVPAIHVRDLAQIVRFVSEACPETAYIVAVDDAQSTLHEITTAISETLGTQKVKQVSQEEALLIPDLTQRDYDELTNNLRFEAGSIKDYPLEWTAQGGLVENIAAIVQEFKTVRKLQALKVAVYGPPGSGKTTLARKICARYKLHHLHTKDVIAKAVKRLEDSVALLEQPSDSVSPEDLQQAQADREELTEAHGTMENGRYSNAFVVKWYRDALQHMSCRNQGFVLDGFPKTTEQAKELFKSDEGDEADAVMKEILPEFVFDLEGSDDFLRERMMNLPEEQVEGTHNNEEEFNRRLSQYHNVNSEDNTVLNFFDVLEIHPKQIDVTVGLGDVAWAAVKSTVGEPRSYGPSKEEREAQEQEDLREKTLIAERNERVLREQQNQMQAISEKRQADWSAKLSEVKKQEREVMEQASVPLRNFLMKHIMPTLTQGLTEVCKVRPEDPIDYLAEYLFKNNPQIS